VKVGDLVKKKMWDDIEYNPHKASRSLGIIISYKKEKGIPGGANIGVAFPCGIYHEYFHHLEVISEDR
jgi:hypothetical protein